MILVVGALHLDVIVTAPRLPQIDETLVGNSVRYALGGKGGNQAVAAARMGAKVAMAGRIGTDVFGSQLLAALGGAGVDCTAVAQGPGASGMSVAIVQDGGEYGAVIVSGENLNLSAGDIVLSPGTKILLLQNEIPEAVNLALARRARAAGIRTILNAAPARALPAALLDQLDLLVVNLGEARTLLGNDLPADAAVQQLAALVKGAVIVTSGAAGLALCETGRVQHIPAFQVNMISAHGAGDCFIGALAAEWARGRPLAEAARFAAAFAAFHVATPADARGALGRADVQELIDR